MRTLDIPRLGLDHPKIQELLAEQTVRALNTGVYASYLCAIDVVHGGDNPSSQAARELQLDKSRFARSEYPLLPHIWTLHDDSGDVTQQMLEIAKIDPENGEHPYEMKTGGINGTRRIDATILVAIFSPVDIELWRNPMFDPDQSSLLLDQAHQIQTILQKAS